MVPSPGDHDRAAGLRSGLGNRRTDAAATAGDEDDVSGIAWALTSRALVHAWIVAPLMQAVFDPVADARYGEPVATNPPDEPSRDGYFATYTARVSASFLEHEAMGANRLEKAAQTNMLLDTDRGDAAYDNFFAEQANDQPEMGQDGDTGSLDAHGSIGGGGLIEEEPSVLDDAPQLPGVVLQRRPSIAESDEGDPLAGYRTDRTNSVNVGNYFQTFGERRQALGGGFGGFFGALRGRGMRTANDLVAGRNLRAAQKLATLGPGRSALRSRLANEGSAQAPDRDNSLGFGTYFSTFGERQGALGGGVGGFFGALLGRGMRRANEKSQSASQMAAYPREPGIDYDENQAMGTRRTFARQRDLFQGISRPNGGQARVMMNAHAEYDLGAGTRSMRLGGDPFKFSDDKFNAIMDANERWGQEAAELDASGAPERTRKVRFQDGANDEVGQPSGQMSRKQRKIRPTMKRNIPLEVNTDTPRPADPFGKVTPDFPTAGLSGFSKYRVAGQEGLDDTSEIGSKLRPDFFKNAFFGAYEAQTQEIQDRPRKQAQERVREMFMQRPPLFAPARGRIHEQVPFSPEFQDKQARRDIWKELQESRYRGGGSQPVEETGFWAGGKRFNEGDDIDGYKALGKWDWDQKPPVFDALEHQAPLDDKGNLIGAEPSRQDQPDGQDRQSRDSSDDGIFQGGMNDFISALLK